MAYLDSVQARLVSQGGEAFKILLSPGNQYACTQKLLDTTSALDQIAKAQHFKDPCLNALGGMANGFDSTILFVIGAVVMGAVGFLWSSLIIFISRLSPCATGRPIARRWVKWKM